MPISFEERVLKVISSESLNFKNIFIDKEYLIASNDFVYYKYYILSANKDNFLHLTGVQTNLDPECFFDKAISNNLMIQDFYIGSKKTKVL